jgi:pimeloyl-[acyl-carrier protein] methyl ester esterase
MNIFKEVTGQGPDVVLIHGGAASHLDMIPIAEELASRYRVINIDLPATGSSTWDSSIHTIHDMADRVLAEMPKQAIYIGWSFGGLIAQSIAAKHPQRIKHLIGITTSPKFITTVNWPGFPQPFAEIIAPMLEGKEAKDLMQSFYEYEFEHTKPKSTTYPKNLDLCLKTSTISNDLLMKRLEIADATDLRELFKTISCPIDLILGGTDAHTPKEGFKKIIALNPTTKIHEVQNAGHAPFWTHPKEFNEILNNILK